MKGDEVRRKLGLILDNGKQIEKRKKCNISKTAVNGLHNLKKRKEIVVVRADKGGATVVMDAQDYSQKLEKLVEDKEFFVNIKKNPVKCLEKNIKGRIEEMRKAKMLCKGDERDWIMGSAECPVMNGFPKIHKMGNPLHPVVSAINDPGKKISQRLASILKVILPDGWGRVKKVDDVIGDLKKINIHEQETICSLDVISMFPNINRKVLIDIVKEKWGSNSTIQDLDLCETIRWLEWWLDHMYVEVNGQFYKQIKGLSIGSCLSPILAEVVMSKWDKIVKEKFGNKIKLWKRYVDDILCIFKGDCKDMKKVIDQMNTLMEVEVEWENKEGIAYLDIRIMRKRKIDHPMV